jgi:hypothetical protein
MVPAFAILGGWLGDRVLAWADGFAIARRAACHPAATRRRAPRRGRGDVCAQPRRGDTHGQRMGGVASFWLEAMFWLRHHTPEPFPAAGGDAYYYAAYPKVPPHLTTRS